MKVTTHIIDSNAHYAKHSQSLLDCIANTQLAVWSMFLHLSRPIQKYVEHVSIKTGLVDDGENPFDTTVMIKLTSPVTRFQWEKELVVKVGHTTIPQKNLHTKFDIFDSQEPGGDFSHRLECVLASRVIQAMIEQAELFQGGARELRETIDPS
jgi:hypothetical protein